MLSGQVWKGMDGMNLCKKFLGLVALNMATKTTCSGSSSPIRQSLNVTVVLDWPTLTIADCTLHLDNVCRSLVV